MVKVGEEIENFILDAYHNGEVKKVSLIDSDEKWKVLFFYPRDFTFVCPTELRGFASKEKEFEALNCKLIAASTDSVHSHKAWFEQELKEVCFPIIADTNHELSRYFEVLVEETGEALRGTFIIDPEGLLRYHVVSDLNVGRSVDETLRVLQALQTG